MYMGIGIKDVYQGVQGACLQQAVTHARGMAKCHGFNCRLTD